MPPKKQSGCHFRKMKKKQEEEKVKNYAIMQGFLNKVSTANGNARQLQVTHTGVSLESQESNDIIVVNTQLEQTTSTSSQSQLVIEAIETSNVDKCNNSDHGDVARNCVTNVDYDHVNFAQAERDENVDTTMEIDEANDDKNREVVGKTEATVQEMKLETLSNNEQKHEDLKQIKKMKLIIMIHQHGIYHLTEFEKD